MAQKRPHVKTSRRSELGKRATQRLRKGGQLPAVVYGHRQNPAHVLLDRGEILPLLGKGAHLIDVLHEDGATETCLIKDVQYDHLGTNVLHVDLARVDLAEEVSVAVPLKVKGQEKNEALRGTAVMLEEQLPNIQVRCRADAIPEFILVDIANLKLGAEIRVKELTLPEGVRTDLTPESVVLSIRTILEEVVVVAPTAEATSAEPEVITERKKEEGAEGEDAAPEKGAKEKPAKEKK